MLDMRSRAMEDIDGAIANYEESVELLMQLPDKDVEVITIFVSPSGIVSVRIHEMKTTPHLIFSFV